MQPILLPIEKKYEDYRKSRSKEGKQAVAEMLKRPYSLQQAEDNLDKLRAERLNSKQLKITQNQRGYGIDNTVLAQG
jgi:hypothetical protein